MRRALLVLAAAAALSLAACGGPSELSKDQVRTLTDAQERIGASLELEETIRTDPAVARRMRARVQKIVSSGSFENPKPDEFGIAMLGELRRFAPSLVLERRGDVYALDKPATRAFLQYATTDAVRALAEPVARQTTRIAKTIGDADAKDDTKVPPLDSSASSDETVKSYLRSVQSDLRPRYPAQAARLAKVLADASS